MKKYFFFIIWVGITLTIGGLSLKINPNVELIESPQPQIIQPTLTPTPKPQKITLAAVGDVGLGREINYQIIQKENPNFPFQKIKEVLSKADIVIGNLEGPVIENCPIIRTGFRFCGRPENVAGLKYAGFSAMSLANNHIYDYGREGLNQTVQALKENKIGYFIENDIWHKQIYQTKFAFLGFDDTVSRIENSNLKTQIKKAKENIDILVVSFHWGEEYQPLPNSRQRELAELSIDAGADIIIGHHPHVIQPLEDYQGKPIFYSLGNFVFDQMWSEETRTGGIGWITIENNQIVETNIDQVYMFNCCQPELIE